MRFWRGFRCERADRAHLQVWVESFAGKNRTAPRALAHAPDGRLMSKRFAGCSWGWHGGEHEPAEGDNI